MNHLAAIRQKLDVTQASLAQVLGVTQSNVSHYENGQTMPPDVARRLIAFASGQGVRLTFDDVYAESKEANHA